MPFEALAKVGHPPSGLASFKSNQKNLRINPRENLSMKSIMQEGSSVTKAIEKAWEAAGKPKEFSIKVFEEEQRNFLGMTTKSAKIAIFFDGKIAEPEKAKVAPRPIEVPKKKERKKEAVVETKPVPQPTSSSSMWSEQMIKFVDSWLQKALTIMGLGTIRYSLTPDHYQLKILFSDSLNKDMEKEKSLFRSFSLFIIQALRHKFHRPMRGFYIVFGQN